MSTVLTIQGNVGADVIPAVRVVEYRTGRRLKYRGVSYSQSVHYSSWPANQQLVYRTRRYRPAQLMLSGLLSREESKGLRRNKAH